MYFIDRFVLTDHAKTVLQARGIEMAWIAKALKAPQKIESDPEDKVLEHRLIRIAERGARVLRVIVDPTADPARVITAFFDRKAGKRL